MKGGHSAGLSRPPGSLLGPEALLTPSNSLGLILVALSKGPWAAPGTQDHMCPLYHSSTNPAPVVGTSPLGRGCGHRLQARGIPGPVMGGGGSQGLVQLPNPHKSLAWRGRGGVLGEVERQTSICPAMLLSPIYTHLHNTRNMNAHSHLHFYTHSVTHLYTFSCNMSPFS